MSIEVIYNDVHKARKIYFDDGWEDINEWMRSGYYSFKKIEGMDQLILEEMADNQPSRIQPGQLYQRQFNKYEGDAEVWRTKKFFYEIMCKYDLFPEY